MSVTTSSPAAGSDVGGAVSRPLEQAPSSTATSTANPEPRTVNPEPNIERAPRTRHGTWNTNRESLNQEPRTATSEAGDVRKSARHLANVLEPIEQHRSRIPLTAHEGVAQGGGDRAGNPQVAGGDHTGFDVDIDDGCRRSFDGRLQFIDRLISRGHARHAEDRRVAEKNLGE